MEPAHIINRPGHEVGDKALTLCGVKWKIRTLWVDLPKDHPICRDCVDVAVKGMTDVTNQLAFATRRTLLLFDVLSAENDLTAIIDDQRAYNDKQEAKAIAKAEKKQAKKDRKAEKQADALLGTMAADIQPGSVQRTQPEQQYRPGFEGAVLAGAVNTQEELDSWRVQPPIAPERGTGESDDKKEKD
jgi:hypothetical protein